MEPQTPTDTLWRPDGTALAYDRFAPENAGFPAGVIFMHGFQSDMNATKAVYLADSCRRAGIPFIRYNAYAHGKSADQGGNARNNNGAWPDFTISRAVHDALLVLDTLTTGPQILMGSSMGGWVALRLMEERPERVAGIIGIATAPDFVKKVPAANADYTQALIDDGPNNYVMDEAWTFDGPVHLLQGKMDDRVHWQTPEKIAPKFPDPSKVKITLIEGGDHRLNRPEDLALQEAAISDVMKRI